MSLSKPVLFSQPAFDATQSHVFEFSASGGDQVVKNKLTIFRQRPWAVVYSQEQTTYSLLHTLEADVLENGEYYTAYIETYNSSGEVSSHSSFIQFYCFTAPSFSFSNLSQDAVISNSSFEFELAYYQLEGEQIESYNFNLYDAQGVKIATSGIKYAASSDTLSHSFSGFIDNTLYFIEAEGKTVYGTTLSTERIRFNVSYFHPNVFSAITLKNNCSEGYITIQSNLISIDGETTSAPIFQEGSYIVLTDDTVTWNSGFSFGADGFTASLWGKFVVWEELISANKQIIGFSNIDGNTLKIGIYKDYEDSSKIYADLVVKTDATEYHICSDSIQIPNDEEIVQIWFRKKYGYYSIKLINLSE